MKIHFLRIRFGRTRLLATISLLLLVTILAACRSDGVIPRPPSPTLPPVGEPGTTATFKGAFVAWGVNANAIPPTRSPDDPLAPGGHILGIDCLSYLGSGGDVGAKGVWNNRKAFDWGPLDRCIAAAAGQTVKLPDGRSVPQPVILTLPSSYADTGSRYYQTQNQGAPGSATNPFIRLHLPPWMQNDVYRFTFQAADSGNYYQSIRYDGEFKQRAIEFVQAAGRRYNGNVQIAAVRVAVGIQGESHPIVPCASYWDATLPKGGDQIACGGDTRETVLSAHEAVVSCQAYVSFIEEVAEATYQAFPDKPVVAMVDASPCTTLSGKSFRRNLYNGAWATKFIGVSMNNLNIDRPDVDEAPGNTQAAWNMWTVGRTMNDMGYPMLFEYDSHTPSDVAMYWTTLSGAGNGGDFLLHHSTWNGSFSPLMWEVIDYWLASDQRAWLVFRDHEYPTYDFAPGFGASGAIGDWTKHLRLLNPEDAPQACEPALLAAAKRENSAAVAAGRLNIERACPDIVLPAPATAAQMPLESAVYNRMFNRQARRLDGKELRIAVGDEWPYTGRAYRVDVTVSYLDIGIDAFEIILPNGQGVAERHIITKTGDGAWKRETWSAEARVGNLLDGAFIRIADDGAGAEYLHELYIAIADEEPLSDPTATPFPTLTATSIPAASPTSELPTVAATPPPTSASTATTEPSPTVTRAATTSLEPTATITATPRVTDTALPTPTATVSPVIPAATATVTLPPPSGTRTPSITPPRSGTPLSGTPPVEQPRAACAPVIESTLSLGGPPKAVAAGLNGFYTGLFDLNTVTLVGPDGRASLWTAQTAEGRINGLAVADALLITSNRDTGTATLHDAASGTRLAVLRVGSLPWGVAALGARAFVANFGSGTVSVIDLVRREVIATVFVGPSPVAAIADEGGAYVAHIDGMVTRLDKEGHILVRRKTSATDVRGISLNDGRGQLYLGSRTGYIAVIDKVTLQEQKRIVLAGPAYAVAINPGTGRLFAVDADNNRLYYVEPDGDAVAALPLPAQGGDQGGQGLAVRDNRVAVANLGAGSVTFVADGLCTEQVTPQPTARLATVTPTPMPTATRTANPTASVTPTRSTQPSATVAPQATAAVASVETPSVVRAKIEIVWPHSNASVRDANKANVTAYLFAGDGVDPRTAYDSPPCNWSPTVRLWAALDAQPARQVAIGQKRIVREGGRTFPAWDFNDIDVAAARDPANRLFFYVTVDGVKNLHNVWAHAADARTLFPQTDAPQNALRTRPIAVDARIEIVWPHNGARVQDAARANVTAYLFHAGTLSAIAPQTPWAPAVRLHWSLNNNTEVSPGRGVLGLPRRVTGANGVVFLAWDFNDIDVSAAQESLNRLYFWVTVDDMITYPNIWAHGIDARTLFPQPDVPNPCR